MVSNLWNDLGCVGIYAESMFNMKHTKNKFFEVGVECAERYILTVSSMLIVVVKLWSGSADKLGWKKRAYSKKASECRIM